MSRKAAAPARWRNQIVRYADEAPDQLLAHPLNPKTHPKMQQDALAGAISEVGWIAPVIVNETTGHVIDGHARIGLAISRGEPSVPVAYVQLTEEAERLALATFDPIGALAVADQDNLAALLEGLTSSDEAVANLLRDLAPPKQKALNPDDADLTPPPEPITKPGDLWLLGEHRLLCGDATNADDIARLMDGAHAELCLTDPPYNVGIDYGEDFDDSKTKAAYLAWTLKWFASAKQAAKCVVVTTGMVNLSMWFRDVAAPAWVCSWRKANQQSPSGLRGWNGWEPLLVYGKPVKAVGQDAWDIPVALDPTLEGLHAVPKTLKAWATFVDAFSDTGDLVLDLFSGAGTTLVAAEQEARRCHAMEIEPAYVDVAVRRWERVSGRQAVKANA